jgi:Transposase IS200 like
VSPDHIHLLLSAPPILAPAKLAQYIKGRSSRDMQAEFPELRKQYWGQHMWARGYFCATAGAVDEATIKAYIENQRWAKTTSRSRSQRPRSLEPALQPGTFRRLEPQCDFQSLKDSTGFQQVVIKSAKGVARTTKQRMKYFAVRSVVRQFFNSAQAAECGS